MFGTRHQAPGPLGPLSDAGVGGALVAHHLADDLWLLSSGSELVLLTEAGADPDRAHRRVVDAANRLRRALCDLLTVAPFVEPLVLVPDDCEPGPAEVSPGLVRYLLTPAPDDLVVRRVAELIGGGHLGEGWRLVP